ncbi:MAG: ABC transporter substrate-binding protein [Armatimonadetes bacterium]|nr:ABC transporter substrate-binding protein [Armatimonadota bacterium]
MARISLVLALEDYDRTHALIEETVRPEGIDLVPIVVGSSERHARTLRGEFDAAEMSLSQYIMAKSRGADMTAIPVFPRRLFSHACVYVHTGSNITQPQDLVGRRIGTSNFQFTMAVVARGDLHHHYGVRMTEVTWVTVAEELVPFTPPPGVRIEHRPGGNLNAMVDSGEVDAHIYPDVIPPYERGSPGVRRLFPNFPEWDRRYYEKTGVYPIMHLVAIRDDVHRRHPWVARSLWRAFEEAKRRALEHLSHPFNVSLAWGRWLLEEERAVFGRDPYPYDLSEGNRRSLEMMMRYQIEQGLLEEPLPLEALFAVTAP